VLFNHNKDAECAVSSLIGANPFGSMAEIRIAGDRHAPLITATTMVQSIQVTNNNKFAETSPSVSKSSRSLYVSPLPIHLTEKEFIDYFAKYGECRGRYLVNEKDKQAYGYITYTNKNDADRAVSSCNVNGLNLFGTNACVQFRLLNKVTTTASLSSVHRTITQEGDLNDNHVLHHSSASTNSRPNSRYNSAPASTNTNLEEAPSIPPQEQVKCVDTTDAHCETVQQQDAVVITNKKDGRERVIDSTTYDRRTNSRSSNEEWRNTIFIEDLPWHITDSNLVSTFSKFGECTARVDFNQKTMKVCAYITFIKCEDVDFAINAIHVADIFRPEVVVRRMEDPSTVVSSS
jgi:RNA recognition motif-containing protein